MLCLNSKEIDRAATYKELVDAIEKAFLLYEKGDFLMPQRMHVDSGDIINPLQENLINDDQLFTIGKLLNNSVKKENSELQIFKSVGMALFDLIVSDLIYQKAIDKGLGTEIDL